MTGGGFVIFFVVVYDLLRLVESASCPSMIVSSTSQSFKKDNYELVPMNHEIIHKYSKSVQTPSSTKLANSINYKSFPKHIMGSFDYLNVIRENILANKLETLAEKINKAGGERKIRKKIKNYLKKVPLHFLDDDIQFQDKIPDIIIKCLKELYLKVDVRSYTTPLKVFRLEIPKDNGNITTEVNLRSIIKHWVENLPVNKRNILGEIVRRDDIFKYTLNILKPIVTDRPRSEKLYRQTLRWHITEILKELRIISNSFDKKGYLNRLTNTLLDQILNIYSEDSNNACRNNVHEDPSKSDPSTHVTSFVIEEMEKFMERTHLNVDVKGRKFIEKKIIRILNNIKPSHKDVREEISDVLQKVGKVPQYQAKQFSNALKWHYDAIFKVRAIINKNSVTQTLIDSFSKMSDSSESYTIYENTAMKNDDTENEETYRNELIKKINEWLTNLDIQIPTPHDSVLKIIVVKELADDIIDRQRFLQQNPIEIDKEIELHHIKYRIFKWINKNIGKTNKKCLEHIAELIDNLQAIQVPKFTKAPFGLGNNLNYVVQTNTAEREILEIKSKPYDERLVEEIFEWLHELPVDLYSSEDISLRTNLVRDLVESIEKGLKAKRDPEDLINTEVDSWLKQVLNKRPQCSVIDSLKYKIKAVPITGVGDVNYKQEQICIRRYEDIIDDWIENVPLDPRNEKFVNTRNDLVYELAAKMCTLKNRAGGSEDENKLENYVSVWLKKLPLYPRVDKKAFREQYAGKLVKLLQECNVEESVLVREKLDDLEFATAQLEGAILDWLKAIPLYRNGNLIRKNKLEKITRDFTKEFNLAIQGNIVDPDSILLEYIKKIYADTNQKKDFIQNVALQLKLHLMKLNMFGDLSQRDLITGDMLDANIAFWLHDLPLNLNDPDIFERKRQEFLHNIRQMRALGIGENTIKEEILIFVKNLPIDTDILNDQFVVNETDRLLEILTIVPIEDMPRKEPPKSRDIVHDAILNWSKHLPMLPVYCPTNFKSLINEMATNITKLIVHPEHSLQEDNEEQMQIEIGKYLERFPLRSDIRVRDIENMITELLSILKDIKLYRDDDDNNRTENIEDRLNANTFITQNNCDNRIMYPKSNTQNNTSGSKGESSNLSSTKTKITHKKSTIIAFAPEGSKQKTDTRSSNVNLDGSTFLDMAGERQDITNGLNDLPEGMTLEELYEYFIKIFKDACQQIPIDPSKEEPMLAENAPHVINNGIWKMLLTMMANPKIANDYVYFEFLLEERLDDMLDIFSQTEEMVKFRHAWKSKIVAEALKMLKYYQSLTDAPSFRAQIIAGLNRDMIINNYKKMDYMHQYLDTCKIADCFIMQTKYKEEDPIKEHVYRQRLINEIEELINQIKAIGHIEYGKINRDFLCRKVMEILENVPVPEERILREEAEEILLGNEIEQWYRELPVRPIDNASDGVLRQRTRRLLAKKLLEIENKMLSLEDSTYEREMKHEMSKFLENCELQHEENLNINFMIEELAKRLENRRKTKNVGYETFKRETPMSSSFVQSPDFLTPLVNIEDDNQLQIPNKPITHLPRSTMMINPIEQVECSSNQVGTKTQIRSNQRPHLSTTYPYQTNPRSQLSGLFPRSQYYAGVRVEQTRVPQYNPNTIMINPIEQVEYSSSQAGTLRQIPNQKPCHSATYPYQPNQLNGVEAQQSIPSQFSRSFPQRQYLHPYYPGARFEQQTRAQPQHGQGSQGTEGSDGTRFQVIAGSHAITGSQGSTARIANQTDHERVEADILEDEEDSEEPVCNCKCMDRISRCRMPCPMLRKKRRPRCIPMPYAHRYFY